jgi:hypothetical protein
MNEHSLGRLFRHHVELANAARIVCPTPAPVRLERRQAQEVPIVSRSSHHERRAAMAIRIQSCGKQALLRAPGAGLILGLAEHAG